MANETQALYILMEAGNEVETVANLYGAAKWWSENPSRRGVWRLGPSFDGLMPKSQVPEERLAELLREVAPYKGNAV